MCHIKIKFITQSRVPGESDWISIGLSIFLPRLLNCIVTPSSEFAVMMWSRIIKIIIALLCIIFTHFFPSLSISLIFNFILKFYFNFFCCCKDTLGIINNNTIIFTSRVSITLTINMAYPRFFSSIFTHSSICSHTHVGTTTVMHNEKISFTLSRR